MSNGFCDLPHFTCLLTIFDSSKGAREGQEDEKIMGFFPASIPKHTQHSIIGLSQALFGFTENFSQNENDPYLTMEAQMNTWCMYHCEPNIWILMVINKAWAGPSLTYAAVRAFLSSLHDTALLLTGPLQQLSSQEEGTSKAYDALQPLLVDFGRQLMGHGPKIRLPSAPVPHTKQAARLVNPLGGHVGVPLLPTPPAVAAGVESLGNQLLNTPVPVQEQEVDTSRILGVHMSWNGLPIYSNLSNREVSGLQGLSQAALLPASGIGVKKAGTLKTALNAAAAAMTNAATSAGVSTPTAAAAGHSHHSHFPDDHEGTAHLSQLSPTSWAVHPFGSKTTPASQVPIRSQGAQSNSKPGSDSRHDVKAPSGPARTVMTSAPNEHKAVVTTDSTHDSVLPGSGWIVTNTTGHSQTSGTTQHVQHGISMDPGSSQMIWLCDHQLQGKLLAAYHGSLLVCIVLPASAVCSTQLVASIEEVLSRHCERLNAQLAACIPSLSILWHQQGYRYAFQDAAANTCRSTPLKKVTTLTDTAVETIARLRNRLDTWASSSWQDAQASGAPNDVSETVPGWTADAADFACGSDFEIVCKMSGDTVMSATGHGHKQAFVLSDISAAATLCQAGEQVDRLHHQLGMDV